MSLNRSQNPNIKENIDIKLISHKTIYLDNGIKVIAFDSGNEEVVKIGLYFNAGSWLQKKPGIAPATANLINAGTKKFSSRQIAEAIDYYGAFSGNSATKDISDISLFTLNKHLSKLLPIIEDIIKNPTYPKNEIQLYRDKRKQLINLKNNEVNYIAQTRFHEKLFGKGHPYGIYLKEEHLKNIEQSTLKEFHSKHYTSGNCYISVSGKLPHNLFELLNKHFGQADWGGEKIITTNNFSIISEKGSHHIDMPGKVQSSYNIGKILFNRTHPDYPAMRVVNTIFGGYFGSRLMKNIRQEKGYTYGIHSDMVSMKNAGYFIITADTGAEVTDKAIKETYIELDKMRQELISCEELDLVKNQLLGTFLRMVDGSFAACEFFNTLYQLGLD
ncbi:MAG: pitrilysin family protein, partial [Bacteroidota bacterium]|nr:pitrilysin family protein [Bacteroidota bacterium]